MPVILLVNGNTNSILTEHMAGQARLVASTGTAIVAVTAPFGARFVATRADEIVAAHAVLQAVEQYAGPYDAVLVAISLDCAVPALRQKYSVPVIGMTEAACHFAHMSGQQFCAVTADHTAIAAYRERIDALGMSMHLASIHAVNMSPQQAYADKEATLERLTELMQRLVQEEGCEAIVPLGAAFTGLHQALQSRTHVPVFDGLACATLLLESMLKLEQAVA